MAVGEPASRAAVDDLRARLRVLAKGRETLDVAQLHFVSLGEIQQAYGARWPEHKSRIQDAAESFLRKRVGASDMLVRGEGGFLLVLGVAAGPEAHAITAQLTHGLNAFFTGQGGTPPPRFTGTAQSFATRDLEGSFGAIDVVAPAPEPAASERSGSIEPDWKFEPVWDVKREALSHWFVTAFNRANGVRIPGYQFENGAAYSSHFVKIDEAGLWVAEQALQDLLTAGKQTLIGSVVHAQSLTNVATRARILATIDRLNPEFHRYRIVKIAGVTQGFPRLYLKELVGVLRSRQLHVVMTAFWDEPDIATMMQPGLTAVGLVTPASGVMSGPVIAIPALMARINEATKIAHDARARFFVEGAVTKYLALKFASAGVDNIASEHIWPTRATADGMLRWPANRLAAA
ncbi:hypothetical protein DF3PB_10135 [uncultured Defluviicoccus sp.]|uniref:GGDEF domain-containing protein n=1 Tax=metagenome TaxID=256318 RepID=A0A380T9Q2_9ZZZZ|nr:hypothetical protein DF3PB_10135 [uncultured Defluviicoccus sp.]